MCITAKASISAFIIILFMSVMLLYRNALFDKEIASVAIIISLIQLVEYGIHTKVLNSSLGGKLLFVILWLQIAVFSCYRAIEIISKPSNHQ